MDTQPHDIAFSSDQDAALSRHDAAFDAVCVPAAEIVASLGDPVEGPDLATEDFDHDSPEPGTLAQDGTGSADDAADALRPDLVTAEVAAVLALIAHDYFSRPLLAVQSRAGPEEKLGTSAAVSYIKARQERRTAQAAEPCKIIQFPGRRA